MQSVEYFKTLVSDSDEKEDKVNQLADPTKNNISTNPLETLEIKNNSSSIEEEVMKNEINMNETKENEEYKSIVKKKRGRQSKSETNLKLAGLEKEIATTTASEDNNNNDNALNNLNKIENDENLKKRGKKALRERKSKEEKNMLLNQMNINENTTINTMHNNYSNEYNNNFDNNQQSNNNVVFNDVNVNNSFENGNNDINNVNNNMESDQVESFKKQYNSDIETYKKKKRPFSRRPENWKEIVHHYIVHKNIRKTIEIFQLGELNPNENSWAQAFRRWTKDIENENHEINYKRPPAYGSEIDKRLAIKVMEYYENRVPITDAILRSELILLLEEFQRHDILQNTEMEDRNGKYKFGTSWAKRFYARHQFTAIIPDEYPNNITQNNINNNMNHNNINAMEINEHERNNNNNFSSSSSSSYLENNNNNNNFNNDNLNSDSIIDIQQQIENDEEIAKKMKKN